MKKILIEMLLNIVLSVIGSLLTLKCMGMI